MSKSAPMPISDFRKNIFKVFELIKNGGEVNISYRRTIYVFSIHPVHEKITRPYRKRTRLNKIPPQSIVTGACEACEDLTQNGVCMNAKCTTNRPMSENEAVAA